MKLFSHESTGRGGVKKYSFTFGELNPPNLRGYKLIETDQAFYVYYKRGKNTYLYGVTEKGEHLLFLKHRLGFDIKHHILVKERIDFKKIFKKFLASLVRYVGLAKRERRNTI